MYFPHHVHNKLIKLILFIGIQTERQKELLKEHGGKIMVVDETHGTNVYKYKLLTCLIVDNNRRGWPVAHLITSRSDAPTLAFFFQSLEERVGSDIIRTVITDDDQALINAMNIGFSNKPRHLLCKWHILKNLKENLRTKVFKDSMLVDSMYLEIRVLIDTKDIEEFKRLSYGFVKKYENNPKTSGFITYFLRHYLITDRCMKWAMCFRNFPHSGINTTGHIESFHNRLKKCYLKRKVNKRLDDLVDLLFQIEWDDYSSRSKECLEFISPSHIHDRHKNGISLEETSVHEESLDTWEINTYVIVKYSSECNFDHCFLKCTESLCYDLCPHQYSCSCPDNHPLCKHIHRLHSFLKKDLPGKAISNDFYTLSDCCNSRDETPNEVVVSNDTISKSSCTEKIRAAKCSSIASSLSEFNAIDSFSDLSDETLTFVANSLTECLQKIKNDNENLKMVPMEEKESYRPNQTLKTQKSQLMPFKRPTKRKPQFSAAEIAEKKKKVVENLLSLLKNNDQ